jgi:hypothetical protein
MYGNEHTEWTQAFTGTQLPVEGRARHFRLDRELLLSGLQKFYRMEQMQDNSRDIVWLIAPAAKS